MSCGNGWHTWTLGGGPCTKCGISLGDAVAEAERGVVRPLVDDGSAAHEPDLHPPPEHEGKQWHWIDGEARSGDIGSGRLAAEWFPAGSSKEYSEAHWMVRGGIIRPCNAALRGWRYLGPAEWNPVAADVAKRLDAGAGAYHALSEANAEIASLRALLSRVEEPPVDQVKADIDRTIDHLVKGQTTRQQRQDLSTATERAERDAAVGRAIK